MQSCVMGCLRRMPLPPSGSYATFEENLKKSLSKKSLNTNSENKRKHHRTRDEWTKLQLIFCEYMFLFIVFIFGSQFFRLVQFQIFFIIFGFFFIVKIFYSCRFLFPLRLHGIHFRCKLTQLLYLVL